MDCYRFSTGHEIIELPLVADIRKIYVEATTECNFSCITCIRHGWGDQIAHMTEATFAALAAGFKDLPQLQTIHFGGFGEPLCHPRILTMLETCKRAGYKVEMITNGSLLTADIARTLIDLELDWLYVSLDGPTAACFEQMRPGAKFNDVVSNITDFQKLKTAMNRKKPLLGIEFVATKTNFSALPDMRKTVDKLGADKFIVSNVIPYHESMKDEILYDSSPDLSGFGHESVLLSVKTAPQMQFTTRRSCKFILDKALAVSCDGSVAPCYAFMHNHNCYIFGRKKQILAHAFGNVNERSLKDIWTDPKYAVFRWIVRNNQYPSCTDCRQIDGCMMASSNEADCWGNQPSCGDCLWAREIIVCP